MNPSFIPSAGHAPCPLLLPQLLISMPPCHMDVLFNHHQMDFQIKRSAINLLRIELPPSRFPILLLLLLLSLSLSLSPPPPLPQEQRRKTVRSSLWWWLLLMVVFIVAGCCCFACFICVALFV